MIILECFFPGRNQDVPLLVSQNFTTIILQSSYFLNYQLNNTDYLFFFGDSSVMVIDCVIQGAIFTGNLIVTNYSNITIAQSEFSLNAGLNFPAVVLRTISSYTYISESYFLFNIGLIGTAVSSLRSKVIIQSSLFQGNLGQSGCIHSMMG